MAIKFKALKVSYLSLRFHKKCSKVGDSSISDPLTGSKARLKTSEKLTIGSPLILYDISEFKSFTVAHQTQLLSALSQ